MRHHQSNRAERITRHAHALKEGLFRLLKISLVSTRKPLQNARHGARASQHLRGTGSHQLKYIRILLLWHNAAARAVL